MLQIFLKRSRRGAGTLWGMAGAADFVPICPEILYFGTPVAVLSSLNPDGTTNLAALSSFWALGDRIVLGLKLFGQSALNLRRYGECVLNLPSPRQWREVERLGHTTARTPLTDYHRAAGIGYAKDKFATSGFTPLPSQCVMPVRAAECPVHIEAAVIATYQASDDAPFVYVETRKLLVHAQRDVLNSSATRFDIDAWSPLFYVFRHYFGKGSHLGASFRAAPETD
jgi:flavin reductase (DIM6/NTAB) family NADH-FMN oxidoreductase RutF